MRPIFYTCGLYTVSRSKEIYYLSSKIYYLTLSRNSAIIILSGGEEKGLTVTYHRPSWRRDLPRNALVARYFFLYKIKIVYCIQRQRRENSSPFSDAFDIFSFVTV